MSTGSEAERVWRRRLERFEVSDLTAVEFCRSEEVSTASFYQWRRRLESASPSWMRPGSLTKEKDVATFLPVRWTASAGIELVLPNGTRVNLGSADPELLRAAIDAAGRLHSREAASC